MLSKTTLPVSSARKKIFSIMKDIQKPGAYYTLTERGIPRAVIVSAERFERVIAGGGSHAGSLVMDAPRRSYAARSGYSMALGCDLRIFRDEAGYPFAEGADEEENKYREEGYIKAVLFVELTDKYDYPLRYIELGRYVQRSGQSGKRYIEADMLVGDRNGDIVSVFEVAPFDDYEKRRDSVVSDLYDIAEAVSWRKRPKHLVYYSRAVRNGKPKEKIAVIDHAEYPDFEAWKKGGRVCGSRIPAFGI